MNFHCYSCGKTSKNEEDLSDCKKKGEIVMPVLDEKEKEKALLGYQKQDAENQGEVSESENLFNLAHSKIKRLVISQNNTVEVYAVIEINGHVESVELSSSRAMYWLNHIHRNHGKIKIKSPEFFKNIQTTIISEAQINSVSKEKVYNRIAFVDDVIYYDLGTPDWKIVKITAQSIDVVPYAESMPIFRRTQSTYGQVMPKYDDPYALEKLAELLHIKDKTIFKVHLTSFFLGQVPVPIMVFDGAAGSMKTTITAAIKRMVDPSGVGTDDNCASMATKDNLIVQLSNRYMSAFDNVTKITQDDSNVLCRAITGSGNQKRALYTNSDEAILNFRSKIVLNGIVLNHDFPDLLDRIVTYERTSLGENDRLTEQEFQEKFDNLLPYALGQIFLSLQKSLSIHDAIKQDIRPKTRLADFEIWGESISRAMNHPSNEFLNKFYEKQKQGSISVRDTHPIVQAIELLMEDRDTYEDTAQRCMAELKCRADELGINTDSQYVRFPKSANRLVPELTVVQPVLNKLGYEVTSENYTRNDKRFVKNSRIIKIKKISNPSSPSSTHSLDACLSDTSKNGEKIGDSKDATPSMALSDETQNA